MHLILTSFQPIWVESRFSQGREFRGFTNQSNICHRLTISTTVAATALLISTIQGRATLTLGVMVFFEKVFESENFHHVIDSRQNNYS